MTFVAGVAPRSGAENCRFLKRHEVRMICCDLAGESGGAFGWLRCLDVLVCRRYCCEELRRSSGTQDFGKIGSLIHVLGHDADVPIVLIVGAGDRVERKNCQACEGCKDNKPERTSRGRQVSSADGMGHVLAFLFAGDVASPASSTHFSMAGGRAEGAEIAMAHHPDPGLSSAGKLVMGSASPPNQQRGRTRSYAVIAILHYDDLVGKEIDMAVPFGPVSGRTANAEGCTGW